MRLVPLALCLLATAAPGCRRTAGGEASTAPSSRAAPPASVPEALECARALLAQRGFSETTWSRDGRTLTASRPYDGTEVMFSGRPTTNASVWVTIRALGQGGYPKIETRSSGRTRPHSHAAAAAAADVEQTCPVRLGAKEPPPA